ncbi:hypothetical protein DRN44_08555 [Thermococci archaeon]|nr:MAG: hypothetical protein DRN44_08555 [Thermococci archaeon]
MCRISFIYGEDIELMKATVWATVQASENDKYKNALGYGPVHGDGWGVIGASLSSRDSIKRMYYYSSIEPIFKDQEGINALLKFVEKSRRSLVIIHSRYTSIGLSNVFNTHPFHFSDKEFEFWIVHNGTMDKRALELALKTPSPEDISDTYLLGRFIYEKIDKLDPAEIVRAYQQASAYTKSAMNTMGMFHSVKGELHAVITAYINEELRDNQNAIEYYKLVELISDNVRVVVSSTIADIIQHKFQNSRILLNKIYYLPINGSNEEALQILDL